jgi:hypothetical protein
MKHYIFGNFAKALFIASILQCSFTGCNSKKLQTSYAIGETTKSTQNIESGTIIVVHIVNLIDSLPYYQGKTVQTTGIFLHNFETSALYPSAIIEKDGDFVVGVRSLTGLWVDFAAGEQIEECTKENRKLFTIQGIVDTIGRQRSEDHVAILKNAQFVF